MRNIRGIKSLNVNLLEDKILKALIIFSLPILLSSVFQQLYNTVDTMIIGNFLGDVSLAAIGASMAVFQLIVGFSQGFGNGMAIVTARSFGANDEDLLKRSVAAMLVIGSVVVLILMLLSHFLLWDLLKLLRTPENIINEAYAYISIITTFISVTFIYNLLAGLYRAVGNSVMPLIFLVIAAILNIGLDLLFVVSLGMGIEGAAIATVVAQSVSVLLSMIHLIKKMPKLTPSLHHFRIDKELYQEMVGQGLSMAMMMSLVFLGTIILQYAINDMGYLIIAGHTGARRLNSLFIMPILTIGSAVGTFVSQNKGANQRDRIILGVKYGNRLVLSWSLFMILLVYLSSGFMMKVLTGSDEAVVIDTGRQYLLWNAPFYTVLGILFIYRFTLQGLGQKIIPLISSTMEMTLKMLFVLLLIPRIGYFGVILSEPVIWILMTVQLHYSYKKNMYLFPAD